VRFEVGGEGWEARGDWIDDEHEGGGGDYAEGGEGKRLEGAESEFYGEIVDGPDGHDEGDAGDEDGARGAVAVGGIYAHGSEDIFLIIRGSGEKDLTQRTQRKSTEFTEKEKPKSTGVAPVPQT
jgi:hypothetical protein